MFSVPYAPGTLKAVGIRGDRIVARAKIAAQVRRLAFGNPGDVRPVGEGISELRIHHGPGYRVYYVQRGAVLIILLCGGDKNTQTRDIETAKRLAKETE